MVRFLGLRTGKSHCFLLSVSDYVPVYIGRSAYFSLKLFRLNQIFKKGELKKVEPLQAFTFDFGPTSTHNDSYIISHLLLFLVDSCLYSSVKYLHET